MLGGKRSKARPGHLQQRVKITRLKFESLKITRFFSIVMHSIDQNSRNCLRIVEYFARAEPSIFLIIGVFHPKATQIFFFQPFHVLVTLSLLVVPIPYHSGQRSGGMCRVSPGSLTALAAPLPPLSPAALMVAVVGPTHRMSSTCSSGWQRSELHWEACCGAPTMAPKHPSFL